MEGGGVNSAAAALNTVIPVVAPGWESCCLGVRMEKYLIAFLLYTSEVVWLLLHTFSKHLGNPSSMV